MKKNNYNELYERFDAYQGALIKRRRDPENPDYRDAVSWTYDHLMDYIRFILWDETPKGMKSRMTLLEELPF